MAEKAKKSYISAQGDESRSAVPGTVQVVFQFANGENRAVSPEDFPEEIRNCFTLNGISQKLGDKYAGVDTAEEAVEAFDDLLSALREGRWLMRTSEAGPRTTDLAAALHAVKSDKYPDVTAAAKAVSEWDEERRKSALKVPQIAAEIQKIRADRQAAKAAKAAEAAAGADEVDLDTL